MRNAKQLTVGEFLVRKSCTICIRSWESLETELDERTTSKSGELMLLELVNEQ